jgi:hypothetical protein
MEFFKIALEESYRAAVQVDAIVNIEFDIKNFAKPSMVDYFND